MTSHPKPRWRLLFVPPRDGPENMARDVALLNLSRSTGECVLSIYSWLTPTLSLGRNQTAKGLYDTELIAAEAIDVVRRPTGGRAIMHDHEITYAVTGPNAFGGTLWAAYEQINELLLSGLRSLGVPAQLATPQGSAPLPELSPCFAEPVKGELIALGKKLVGSAQYRENGAFLQHGSILIENDQDRLAQLTLGDGPAEPESSPATLPATLTDLLGRAVTPRAMADVLFDAVRMHQDCDASPLDEAEIRNAALLLRPKFVDPLWTWRR